MPTGRAAKPGPESAPPIRRSRIKAMHEATILAAALEMFSQHGFRGTTIDQIAARAGMSKPNLLYYFKRKDTIYLAVLERTLSDWLAPLTGLDADGDPIAEISRYIRAKIAMSQQNPMASKLFALEILHGAPRIAPLLQGPLKDLVDSKAAIFRRWMDDGRLATVDPHHLIFMIWATTQHYADFDVQMQAILGPSARHASHYALAETTLLGVFLRGLAPRETNSR